MQAAFRDGARHVLEIHGRSDPLVDHVVLDLDATIRPGQDALSVAKQYGEAYGAILVREQRKREQTKSLTGSEFAPRPAAHDTERDELSAPPRGLGASASNYITQYRAAADAIASRWSEEVLRPQPPEWAREPLA